ncbi:MAG TPA: hypothetical protein VM939_07255, partial [Gemmatimonadaceae bacterium]|nr:hypothetical protein [Gemmatimonadaceae bacterium]
MDQFRPQSALAQFARPAAIFDDGERAVADSSARNLSRTWLRGGVRSQALDLVTRSGTSAMALVTLWHLNTGDTAQARASLAWLRGQRQVTQRDRVVKVLPEMLIASRTRRADGAALRSLVDSVALQGCCSSPDFVLPLLAQSYEASGDDAAALRVIRRGAWFWPPRMLATLLREEGRLSAKLGDRTSAIRAYEHYLALRSDPEPSLQPERERIRAEVQMLKRGLAGNPDR